MGVGWGVGFEIIITIFLFYAYNTLINMALFVQNYYHVNYHTLGVGVIIITLFFLL